MSLFKGKLNLIKIGIITGLVVVVLTIVIGAIFSLDGVKITYLLASEVVILLAVLRGIHLAQPESEAKPSVSGKHKKESR